ncbi:putative olfactory receptor 2W6 [Pantherophis guttatus]|uniref:Olfactory receptor n=1 Tax=Pantherophis guttatus TaxID=94885 RepID=A0A6P9B9B9_PANGU|nr:putative olfactory receptor 2W6 [Pantherophis guttatus]XP_060546988.1 putative olfactory receptor 2W6 [Pantherophis guttatus]
MIQAENFTSVKEFILLGLSSHRNMQLLLFGVILIIYLLTVLGNTLIIVLVQVDLRLNTPMYYFLSHLAGVDICYVTSTMPLMLTQLLTGDGTISFTLCIIQMYLSLSLGAIELLLLGVMAYDRYLAICRPLVYPVVMSKLYQLHFTSACWITGPLACVICVVCTAFQNYCGPNQINHFTCELPVVLKLACGDARIAEAIYFSIGAFFFLVPLSIVLTSYGFILRTVLQMKSNTGRHKAFSTCGSHFLVVSLFYGPLFCMYLLPKTDSASDQDKQMAIFYIVITPLLNSIIYTLRNKDIHNAVAKIL